MNGLEKLKYFIKNEDLIILIIHMFSWVIPFISYRTISIQTSITRPVYWLLSE